MRARLIEEGYHEPMRTNEEVRATLRGMLIEAEELERRYRDYLSELDYEDDGEKTD